MKEPGIADDEPTPLRVEQLVREYLESATLMQLATLRGDQPWMAHVWFGFDENLNLYFISRNDRRHSQEIRGQGKVAGGIVTPQLEGLGSKVRGLTFQGVAEELSFAKSAHAFMSYRRRWEQVEQHVTLDAIRKDAIKTRFYQIRPSLYVLFDETNFPDEPRQELPVPVG